MAKKARLCPCGSGKVYPDCCGKVHASMRVSTPEELMRARYSAFCLKKINFLIDTLHSLHPDRAKDRAAHYKELEENIHYTKFLGLEILDSGQIENDAYVTFRVRYVSQNKEHVFEEKSLFQQEEGLWRYRDQLSI